MSKPKYFKNTLHTRVEPLDEVALQRRKDTILEMILKHKNETDEYELECLFR